MPPVGVIRRQKVGGIPASPLGSCTSRLACTWSTERAADKRAHLLAGTPLSSTRWPAARAGPELRNACLRRRLGAGGVRADEPASAAPQPHLPRLPHTPRRLRQQEMERPASQPVGLTRSRPAAAAPDPAAMQVRLGGCAVQVAPRRGVARPAPAGACLSASARPALAPHAGRQQQRRPAQLACSRQPSSSRVTAASNHSAGTPSRMASARRSRVSASCHSPCGAKSGEHQDMGREWEAGGQPPHDTFGRTDTARSARGCHLQVPHLPACAAGCPGS